MPFIITSVASLVIVFPFAFVFRFNYEKVVDPIVEFLGELAEFTMNKIRDVCLFFNWDGLLWRLFWDNLEWSDFEEQYPERARRVQLKTDNFMKWFELQSFKMPITKDVYDWYMKHTDLSYIREVEEKRKKRKKK